MRVALQGHENKEDAKLALAKGTPRAREHGTGLATTPPVTYMSDGSLSRARAVFPQPPWTRPSKARSPSRRQQSPGKQRGVKASPAPAPPSAVPEVPTQEPMAAQDPEPLVKSWPHRSNTHIETGLVSNTGSVADLAAPELLIASPAPSPASITELRGWSHRPRKAKG